MATTAGELERARDAYARGEWNQAFEALSRVDRAAPLEADDLELLARAAYMVGRDDDYVGALERAHHLLTDAGEVPRAARCAFWIGHNLLFRGQAAHAAGWFARADRLLDAAGQDCVERGYLLVPIWLEQMARGDYESGYATAGAAAAAAERFNDADLLWLARDEQARALVSQGRVKDGLRLVDEALVVAGAGQLSPIVTGIVYCNTIAFCRSVYELRHAREWTDALTRWCETQPEMAAHNGLCLVHRAEIMQERGAWEDALEEARRAATRFTQGVLNQLACGKALYQQAEVYRLRGKLAAAEEAYREASRCGCEPQPGLALLRLAQGNVAAALAAIRRATIEAAEPLQRAGVLPAYVEIVLAAGDVDEARNACRELEAIAERQGSEALSAMAAYARGSVEVAEGNASSALVALRRASQMWQELEAPYAAARTRVLAAQACAALGDHDTAGLELDVAREVFERLGAALDLAAVDALSPTGPPADSHGLTPRELEVLRLVAAGKTNRQIAAALVISDHTARRHLQNIFRKLGVSSRAAATAQGLQHDLI
jgi:DNA-binding CsgD family transcriptional regulator